MSKFVIIPFLADADFSLSTETTWTEDGFGRAPHIWPCTIVPARYNGSYEGGQWLAFPLSVGELADGEAPWRDWDGSDIECMEFWAQVRGEDTPIGRGGDPLAALSDLCRRAAVAAGADLADYVAEPTWDRDELADRQ